MTRARETYAGLLMHCAPGTHEAALTLLGRGGAPWQGVLDLGAGTGAFLARLRDAGYTDLEAVDRNPARFQLDGVHCASLDLNAEFAGQLSRSFDLVTALEIIEHLDSPRAFLRQVHSLLTSEGMLLLSTPNVAHWAGRRKFLLTGDLRMFEGGLYHRMRHISPVTETQMRLMLAEVGFAVVGSATAGEFRGPLKRPADGADRAGVPSRVRRAGLGRLLSLPCAEDGSGPALAGLDFLLFRAVGSSRRIVPGWAGGRRGARGRRAGLRAGDSPERHGRSLTRPAGRPILCLAKAGASQGCASLLPTGESASERAPRGGSPSFRSRTNEIPGPRFRPCSRNRPL